MSSSAMASMWSRETTADSIGNGALQWDSLKALLQTGLTEGDLPPSDVSTMTREALEELLSQSISASAFTVAITGHSEQDAAPIVCAVSKGFEEMYGWSREHLLGGRTHILDAHAGDCEAEVKSQMAELYGAEVSIVQTQRKSSGELFPTFQYKRGLSLGSEHDSGDEVWYLLTVSFDISADFERECQGRGLVDYAFFHEAASSIASQVKAAIADAISASSGQQMCLTGLNEQKLSCISRNSDGDELDEGKALVHVSTPEWVECSPVVSKMLDGICPVQRT